MIGLNKFIFKIERMDQSQRIEVSHTRTVRKHEHERKQRQHPIHDWSQHGDGDKV